jgi:hypothetical protein
MKAVWSNPMKQFSLVLVVAAASVIAVPAIASTHPSVAAHPHTVGVHDRTPQAHVRNVTEHHGR